MGPREPDDTRDFSTDIEDLGDNDQDEEIGLTEEYVIDPPEDLVIEEPEQHRDGLSITEYEEQVAREDNDERPSRNIAAESDAVHPTRRP